ncbi:MAG: long-chain-fatty-acid--CoA ligase [Haloarculaceae archaeon]
MPGYPMTLRPFQWRAERLFGHKELVSADGSGDRHRYRYPAYGDRVRTLASALRAAGVGRGDRVGTLAHNHRRHFETYFAVPNLGAQLHTINHRLPTKHVEFIVEDAADRLLFVDPDCCSVLEDCDDGALDSVERFVVFGESVPDTTLEPVVAYESFLDGHDPDVAWPDLSGDQPAGLCYTSGTTGRPKGVEYTQRSTWAHVVVNLTPQGHYVREEDTVLHVVPMAHINGWCLPYEATAAGASQVFPGPSTDPDHLIDLVEAEGVTFSAGVPAVWLRVLERARERDADLDSMERLLVGGAPPPDHMIRGYREEFDVTVRQAWGMTELGGIGAVSWLTQDVRERPTAEQERKQATQGLVVPGLEARVVDDDGAEVPWDGESMGELQVRGPWVTTEYYDRPEATAESFDDWGFRTGDVVTIDEDGYMRVTDRTEHLVKSGGEWISSTAVENALMGHDAVVEAAVVGVPDEEWSERPVAFVVLRGDRSADLDDELAALVTADHPRFWVPDEFRVVDELPKTATGKFDKAALRDRYGSG